jgi:hypothetical protein
MCIIATIANYKKSLKNYCISLGNNYTKCITFARIYDTNEI